MTDSDYSPVNPLPGLVQEYIKANLTEAVISQNIITAIDIDWHGRVEIRKQSWDEYWNIKDNLPEKDYFLCFEKARSAYVKSGFKSDYIKEYCYRYFILLSRWLSHRNESYVRVLLDKLLSLENFVIRWHGKESGTAAATTSHRNPAYLLARLGKKSFNEDPKYLPLIMVKCFAGNRLFYHYRQYRISNDPVFSIFVYPAVGLKDRGESFALVESFANGFSRKSDPRSKQRAQLLSEFAIYPFLKSLLANNNKEKRDINVVDLGGGSGIMLRHIWRHILNKDPGVKKNWYLNGSLIGLRVQNPVRHFAKGSIRGNMAYIDYRQTDYIDWINKQCESFKFDIILMCRLLNNLSIFDIEKTDDEGRLWYISGQRNSPESIINKNYNPVYCLNPQDYHPENIIHTNGKTRLSEDCFAYRVLSLTDYYKAIVFCLSTNINDEMFFYPVRKFNGNSLLNSEGESIIGKLSKIAKLTVIEDVDLTANYMVKHIQDNQLNLAVSAINTDSQYSSQVLALCDKKYADILPGERIC
jgi:hypothetical protein